MLKKPEPAINTEVAEAVELAYECLRSVAPAMEKDGAETAHIPFSVMASDPSKEVPIPTMRGVYDDDRGEAIIAEAKAGQRIAHVVLVEIAEAMVDRGEPLPRNLGQYIMEAAKDGPPKWKRGQSQNKFFYRDTLIAYIVDAVCEIFSIPKTKSRTRKPGSDAMSACSIVVEAMQRLRKEGVIKFVPEERAIESICHARAKRSGDYDFWYMMRAIDECSGGHDFWYMMRAHR